MPELPEVEGYARYFARHALGQKIVRADVRDERILGAIRKEKLARALKGKSFRAVRRHGKHLFADAGEQWLHLHFGMSGDLSYYKDQWGAEVPAAQRRGDRGAPNAAESPNVSAIPESTEAPRFARVIFDFENGAHLAFEDMRLFGVVDLTPSPEHYIDEHELGPDPLDRRFTLRVFHEIAAKRRGAVKSLLMSQDVIAGIGNLYADETLFATGIHPRRAVDTLSGHEVKSIYDAMRRILREVIDLKARNRDYPRRYLIHYREEGDRCPVCGGTIRRAVVFGRTTYFCGNHQA